MRSQRMIGNRGALGWLLSAVLLSMLWIAVSCNGGGETGGDGAVDNGGMCKIDDDCPKGWECRDGYCYRPNAGGDADADSDGDGDTDGDMDGDGDTDAGWDASYDCIHDEDCPSKGKCEVPRCTATGVCWYDQVPDLESCDDGVYCNGSDYCKAGKCVKDTVGPCPIENDCIDRVCNETAKKCDDTYKGEGGDCSPDMFCFGNAPKKCYSGSCVPTSMENDCTGKEVPGPCRVWLCNENTDSCDLGSYSNGTMCPDTASGSTCPRPGLCTDGDCYPRPAACPQTDPCWLVTCSNVGGDVECADGGPVPEGQRCGDECMGKNSFCYGEGHRLICVPDPAAKCSDGDIATLEECSIKNWKMDCVTTNPREIADLACNTSVTLPGDVISGLYRIAEYSEYNATCQDDHFKGYEVPFTVTHTGEIGVTKTTSNPDGYVVTFLILNDMSDPTSCVQMSPGAITRTFADQGPHAFIMELMTDVQFESIGIEISCK